MDMITDRKKANEMTNDYIEFQKQHELKMEPKVEKFNQVDPLKGKSKTDRNQLLRSSKQCIRRKSNTVAKLLEGTSIFNQT